jgi:hypothetical protein
MKLKDILISVLTISKNLTKFINYFLKIKISKNTEIYPIIIKWIMTQKITKLKI